MKKRHALIATTALSLLLAACTTEEAKPLASDVQEVQVDDAQQSKLASLGLHPDDMEYANKHVGKSISDFALFNIEGDTVKPSDFEGQNFLMEFALTSCPACQSIQEDVTSLGLPVLQVFNSDTQEEVEEFAETFKVPTENRKHMLFGDPRKDLAGLYQIQYVPTIFYVDAKGIIQFVSVGGADKEQLEKYIEFSFGEEKGES